MEKVNKLEECCRELRGIRGTFDEQVQSYIWGLEDHIRDLKELPLTSWSRPDPRSFLELSPQSVTAEHVVAEAAERFVSVVWEAINVLEKLPVTDERTDEQRTAEMEHYLGLTKHYNDTLAEARRLGRELHAYWREHIAIYRKKHRLQRGG